MRNCTIYKLVFIFVYLIIKNYKLKGVFSEIAPKRNNFVPN